MHRRQIMTHTALFGAGVALSACGGGNASGTLQNSGQNNAKNILLIHGAWHSAAHWNRVVERLTAQGHSVCALDLPGAGLNAKFPNAYLQNDAVGMATEPSPLAALQLSDYRDAVVAQIRKMSVNGKVTLVAHSLGGVTATLAGEAVPELIQRLVYVTALVPVRLKSILDYGALPENAGSLTTSIWVADPSVVGAARINPRNGDAAYVEKGRQAFYHDIATEDYLRFAALMVPDIALNIATGDGRGTAERWGRVPRSFVRCTQDRSQPIALQDLLIAEADAATPNNKFDVHTLASSHSPFASMPDALAKIIDELA